MPAPESFVEWLRCHQHVDPKYGYAYFYHPRSDSHSIALCEAILDDLLEMCEPLRSQAARVQVAYGINGAFRWPSTGKKKTLDLAIGPPAGSPMTNPGKRIIAEAPLADVFLSCEAKTVMTEHGKSQPRVYDELSSSHEIVHQGRRDAIAAGITVVNIASSFVSPLRQKGGAEMHVTRHKQPDAAAKMIQHLRGLPIREELGQVGFDAYATFVVDCDNMDRVGLWTASPAPQPGDPDHYAAFLNRLSRSYSERFGR